MREITEEHATQAQKWFVEHKSDPILQYQINPEEFIKIQEKIVCLYMFSSEPKVNSSC